MLIFTNTLLRTEPFILDTGKTNFFNEVKYGYHD